MEPVLLFPSEIIDAIFMYLPPRYSISLKRNFVKRKLLSQLELPFLWSSCDTECLEWLIEYNVKGVSPQTWFNAAKMGNLTLLKWLNIRYSDLLRPFTWSVAAHSGNLDVVKFLVEKNPDLCAGLDLVSKAALWGHLHIVKYLMDMGYTPTDDGLVWAASQGHLDIVKELSPEIVPQGSYVFAFNLAATSGHLHVMKFLKEHGFDCTMNPMSGAASGGYMDVVQWLIEQGYRCPAQALTNASIRGDLDMVKLLHRSGCEVSKLALKGAAANWKFQVVKYLRNVKSRD